MKKVMSILLIIVVVVGCFFIVGLFRNDKVKKNDVNSTSSITSSVESGSNVDNNSTSDSSSNSNSSDYVSVDGFEVDNLQDMYYFNSYGENSTPITIDFDVVPLNATNRNIRIMSCRLYEEGAEVGSGSGFVDYDISDKSIFDISYSGTILTVKMISNNSGTLSLLVGSEDNLTCGVGVTFKYQNS